MNIRLMLYLEDEGSLDLFKGVPRRCLERGRRIVIDDMKSKFGALHAKIEVGNGIVPREFESEREVTQTKVRLPHASRRFAGCCLRRRSLLSSHGDSLRKGTPRQA